MSGLALSEARIERAALVTEEAMGRLDVLIAGSETIFVSETATGLRFDPETPLEVWARLVVRLIVAHKRVEWALADAVNFGEAAFGDLYGQWVQETGLNKRTLTNYARIGRLIEPARRRAQVSFSHHEAVVSLPAPEQEKLLDRAVEEGWSRYDLRDAVRIRKATLDAEAVRPPAEPSEPMLVWVPMRHELTPEARAELDRRLAGVGRRHAIGYERAWLDCLLYSEVRDAFVEWKNDV